MSWASQNGVTKVILSNELAAPDPAVSLLFVPALTAKGILFLLSPNRALMIDAEENFKVISVAKRPPVQLYYIDTNADVTDYEEDEYSDIYTGKTMRDLIQNSINNKNSPLNSTADCERSISSEYDSEPESSAESSLLEEESSTASNTSTEIIDLRENSLDSNLETSKEDGGSVSEGYHRGEDPRVANQFAETWHNRLGHVEDPSTILSMIKDDALPPPPCNKS